MASTNSRSSSTTRITFCSAMVRPSSVPVSSSSTIAIAGGSHKKRPTYRPSTSSCKRVQLTFTIASPFGTTATRRREYRVTPARFTVLASGSSGNASLLEFDGFGLLIDCGLHPRYLSARLQSIGATWDRVSAVVLTHTHTDHWKDGTLADLRSRRIPLFGHAQHFEHLERVAPAFPAFSASGLTREFAEGDLIAFTPNLTCRPLRVSHDSVPTFAFRIDGRDGEPHPAWAIGYASDLGCGSPELIEAFAGVDVLALEFNHDEMMERTSPRPRFLVE